MLQSAFIWCIIPLVAYPMSRQKCNIATTHQLALMWMIFALATLFDTNMPPYAVEAHEYYLLARMSLRFAPPAHDTTLTAIQTLVRFL